jgi:hypothetical protein
VKGNNKTKPKITGYFLSNLVTKAESGIYSYDEGPRTSPRLKLRSSI